MLNPVLKVSGILNTLIKFNVMPQFVFMHPFDPSPNLVRGIKLENDMKKNPQKSS